MSAFTIPAGTYDDQPERVRRLSLWNFAIAHKDMDDETASRIVALAMENHEQMMTVPRRGEGDAGSRNVAPTPSLTFHGCGPLSFNENGYTLSERS